MIIELPGTLGRKGHKRFKMGFFHFSNNNLSMRRDCAEALGMYDEQALKSEDVELCFRAGLQTEWVVCRDPGVVVHHKARNSIAAMVKQMWGWGAHLGYAYRKTGRRGIYLYQVCPIERTVRRSFEVENFPWLVCGFFTDLHFFNALLVATLIAALCGAPIVAACAALAATIFAVRHVRATFQSIHLPVGQSIKLLGAYYLANVSFMTATFVGSLKEGVVLIPSAIFPPTPATKS